MQDADNHHGILKRPVVDRVRALEHDTKAGCKALARSARQGEMPNRLKRHLDGCDETGGDRFRCLARNLRPDFRKIALGGIREAKR